MAEREKKHAAGNAAAEAPKQEKQASTAKWGKEEKTASAPTQKGNMK